MEADAVANDLTGFDADPSPRTYNWRFHSTAGGKVHPMIGPAEDGDKLLFALNEIANTNKRRLLVPMGATFTGMHIKELNRQSFSDVPFGIREPPEWDRQTREIVYARFPAGAQIGFEGRIFVDGAFDDVESVRGRSVVQVLEELLVKVESIIETLENRATELYG